MAAPFRASIQKRSDSEQPWTVFSKKMGKYEEPKDKQISSHCISFTAIYIYIYIYVYGDENKLPQNSYQRGP